MNAYGSLSALFVAWKVLLFDIAIIAPGRGYDTSTTLLPSDNKFVRWDAIYYTETARRGHTFEQEWAFGKGLSTLLRTIPIVIHDAMPDIVPLLSAATTGVIISHVSHLISVFLLWQIASNVTTKKPAFIAACLHIISPAGIFLSAPYAEAPFSALSMLGFWLYLKALKQDSLEQFVLLIASGISFGCATLLRSNGLFSGLVFLIDALALITQGKISIRLFATVIAGIYIGVGFALPQLLAYREYCRLEPRDWCNSRFPLIYSFVQSHYWGVGFLRYWTVSNLPLFLLAIPVLILLIKSASEARTGSSLRLAAPQLLMAILAITNYHVQIVTRLSSGYPWHYIWLAEKVCSKDRLGKYTVGFFVIYGLVQAGLFASFLPPA